MKKLVLFLCILCFVGCTSSDSRKKSAHTNKTSVNSNGNSDYYDDDTHLKFKGIPIDGPLDEFISRLEDCGYEHIGGKDGVELLVGEFASYKNCLIGVVTLEKKDLVSTISVVFPEQKSWEYLYGDYKSIKNLLKEKYGKPSSCKETFQSNYLDSDMEKMMAVQMDGCKYESVFEVENGTITLWIEHDGIMSCFVMIRYTDKINSQEIMQHALDDL